MSFKLVLVLLAFAGLLGIAIGYGLRWLVSLGQKGSVELEIKQIRLEAKEEAQNVVDVAEEKAEKLIEDAKSSFAEKEKRFAEKEGYLDQRQLDLDREGERLKDQAEKIQTLKERADEFLGQQRRELERVSHLTEAEAKDKLLEVVKEHHKEDLAVRLQKLERDGKERVEEKARDLLVNAIHRFGNNVNAETLTTSVTLPSDDIKGKLSEKRGETFARLSTRVVLMSG